MPHGGLQPNPSHIEEAYVPTVGTLKTNYYATRTNIINVKVCEDNLTNHGRFLNPYLRPGKRRNSGVMLRRFVSSRHAQMWARTLASDLSSSFVSKHFYFTSNPISTEKFVYFSCKYTHRKILSNTYKF